MDAELRSVYVIKQERDAAWLVFNRLDAELHRHPKHIDLQRKAREQALSQYFPPRLWAILRKAGLVDMSIDTDFEDDDAPFRVWHFSAVFVKPDEEFDCTVDITNRGNHIDEFEPVDFNARPVWLWRRALVENNDRRGEALAAFYYACCKANGDFDSESVIECFPPHKDKREMSG